MNDDAVAAPLENFDFHLLDSPQFKEDSVREELILPILNALGYTVQGPNRIIRSKPLEHPFLTTGSRRRPITLIPDYLLTVGKNFTFVLDAKGPEEEIKTGDNVEQVYSYAVHPEIRVEQFALCNGREFILFDVRQKEPIFYFQLSEIEKHWQALRKYLEPANTSTLLPTRLRSVTSTNREDFEYLSIVPPAEITDFQKQTAKRHFGVHGYFTKQVWSVVQHYIKTFSQPGDTILDPFGGSGVTLVEALMLGRKGIHIDLNPLSDFIVKNLIEPVDLADLAESFTHLKTEFNKHEPKTGTQIERAIKDNWHPTGIVLPKNSDVSTVEELFTRKQLAQLSVLRALIMKEPESVRNTLLLMFSGLLNKVNLTYHSSEGRSEGRGDSSIFRYYRYRIAPDPAEIPIMKYFESRFKKVVAAKKEIAGLINKKTVKNGRVIKGSATDLSAIPAESIDYIYTDPPYGSKIPYLDLSVLWTAWLDLPVTKEDYALEAIEGGETGKTKAEYSDLLVQSIAQMGRVLKYDRWMSFVFAHKDPAYWHLIIDAAEKVGFEYAGCVKQNNGQSSFKKRQNPFTVLSGQLIINFRKVKNPKTIGRIALGAPVMNVIMETIESVIALHHGATLEQINDDLVIRGLELGFLDILAREYTDLTPLLMETFQFDGETKTYNLRRDSKFKTHIPLELRVRYFLLSYLTRMQHAHKNPTFDEIILNIMPLLKNGITPEHQTILNVLENIAERVGVDRWRLHKGEQQELLFSQ
jgi:16S rRNA G966 N2-methylase RsmD